MEANELHEARTNPDFLECLDDLEKKALESKSLSGLYQVLDSLLVLDLDEERVHTIYQEILKAAFDGIEDRLKEDEKLSLDNDDIFYIRSFYEHAIEKWSMNNAKGAKELFFILTQICEDELLVEALNVHLIACSQDSDMDHFYEENDCATCIIDPCTGVYNVYSSTQLSGSAKHIINTQLQLNDNKYKIINNRVGGGFGGNA